MIEVFKKIWKFAGKEQGNIKKSILLGFINAMFYAIQFGAIFVVLDGLLKEEKSTMTALIAFLLMLLSIIGRIVMQRFFYF